MTSAQPGSGQGVEFAATAGNRSADIPVRTFNRLLKRIARRTGIPKLLRHRLRRAQASTLTAVCAVAGAVADSTFDAPGNSNPIVPGYFADPTIKQFGDTFYLYATTDGNGGGRGPATVWVSRDFVNWVLVPMNWPTTPHYWAPDVVKRPDGRYYLFYNQPCSTFAGVSDSPLGPWTPLTPDDGLVIKDRLVKDVITLDTQLFEDKDGTLYGHWGTWGIFPNSGCGWGVFNPDMQSFARLGMIPNTQAKDFFEAPFMIERNGVYYFTYSSGSCHDDSYRVQYAVSDKPEGEFKMGPNNPILATTADGKVHGPGHHSILQQSDEYFIVYHRHDIPVMPNGMHRQTCADRLVFESDGVIKEVEPTHAGIGYLGPKSRSENLAYRKKVTASSFYHDTLRKHDYKPEYAVDDNNATLWRPADNRMGNWLTVDLGSAQRVGRTEAQFEYATWFYQYLIESSLDGQTWKTFADRRQNTRWGSPMVDDGDAETRFLRITVTSTEYPGLFGALWNFKAYADSPADPLLAMADKAFEQVVASKPRSSRGNEAQRSPAVSQSLLTSTATSQPLIHLDVGHLQLGSPIAGWTNQGTLGGEFTSRDSRPVVGMAAGRKAVHFSGRELLTASLRSPRALAGNSSFTVTAWVNNPEIGEGECYLSWAGRGGPDAATSQFGYGTHPEFGAVGHWGFADLGFRGGPPKVGQWHHLAVVFDGLIERLYVDGQLNHSEAKMLMMHEGRPVYVGASEPDSEYLDGYLASLRVYGGALSGAEVKKLAADEPSADLLVHLDSAKLDYGPLRSWANNGSLGGAFSGDGKAPVVEDVNSRVAVCFEAGQSLYLTPSAEVPLGDFTLLASVANPTLEAGECVVEVEGPDGSRTELLTAPPAGDWQEVALVYHGGRGTLLLDGKHTTRMAPAAPKAAKAIRIGGKTPFSGSLSRVQLFRRALVDEEILQLSAMAKQERRTPAPSPATFAQAPAALRTTAIAMTAQPARAEPGGLEYNFTETTGHAGASSSGWIPKPFFLDDGLKPNTRYAYSVKVRDALGNVTATSAPAEATTASAQFQELTDKFDTGRDLLTQGTDGTLWSGFLGKPDDSSPEAIAAKDGALRLQSKGTVWDGGRPLGAFLFKLVPGDFVAEATVADYAGLATRKVPGNNDGGLMVRVPKSGGRGERLMQLNFFPIWNQGNMVTVLDGGRSQKGNGLAWNAHRHLQIIRQGGLFYFRTSADGQQWHDMPGSPVERNDMAGIPLQVGLYHASYGGDSSCVTFSGFRLVTRADTSARNVTSPAGSASAEAGVTGTLPSLAIAVIEPPEQHFFAKRLDYAGIPIKAAAVVADEALIAAHGRLSMMLSNLPSVRANLQKAGATLHIIGRDQVTTDLPEWRHDKGKPLDEYNGLTRDQRTRGMGGLMTSCGEENLLKLEQDRYRGRDICVHEFAHNILGHGLTREVRDKVKAQLRRSLDSGLWVGSYAGSNYHEFFAELAMWYFGTRGDLGMKEPKPANGRDGLKAYDPEAFALLDDIFSGRYEPTAIQPPVTESTPSK